MDASHPYSAELNGGKAKQARKSERERARVIAMNDALDKLRDNIPISTDGRKKLSKFETLKLARNYIEALQKMLQTNEEPTPLQFANTLANGLSLATTNTLAYMLQVKAFNLRYEF